MKTMPGDAVILIVADDPDSQQALAAQVESSGCRALPAPNGTAALELLASNDILIALVDVSSPILDSMAVLQAIHQYDQTLPCILLTDPGSRETAIQTFRKQAYDYLTRPFNMVEFTSTIDRAIDYARLLRQQKRTPVIDPATFQETEDRLTRTASAALMGQLAEGLRHELGNALTVIQLNMNLLGHYREDRDRFEQHMQSLERGVYAIERIALALRDFPTSESATRELLDLNVIISRATRQAQQAHPEFSGILTFQMAEPAHILGTAFQIIHTLINIIENAIEAALSISQESPRIEITVSADGDLWRIAVQDTGPGFTPDALTHAIEPGFTTKTDRGYMRGLGLGLFVASHVIDNHDGHLQLSNMQAGGALVAVWLPQATLLAPRKADSAALDPEAE